MLTWRTAATYGEGKSASGGAVQNAALSASRSLMLLSWFGKSRLGGGLAITQGNLAYGVLKGAFSRDGAPSLFQWPQPRPHPNRRP